MDAAGGVRLGIQFMQLEEHLRGLLCDPDVEWLKDHHCKGKQVIGGMNPFVTQCVPVGDPPLD